MTPKDLLQSLKDNLEREASTEINDITMQIQYSNALAKATVMKFVEGKWMTFEVLARPVGVSEPIGFD